MIEQHVTSLELSKKLAELGVKQVSLFYWLECLDNDYVIHSINPNHYETDVEIFLKNHPKAISAFLASELGELLPKFIYGHCNFICVPNLAGNFCVTYKGAFKDNFFVQDKLEPNARAKMLIHLIENGLVKVEDLK